MRDYLYTEHLIEERGYIDDISLIRMNLKYNKGKVPTIIMYHGWSSDKESQRLRAFILANLGYQVLIPDAINHGDRDRLENYDAEDAAKYFWPTVLNNIEEAKKLIDYCILHCNSDPERIGVIGHSMGGFSAAGVFTYNEFIKTAVILNGSFNWRHFNQIVKKGMSIDDNRFDKEEERLDSIDPMNNLGLIINRPVLLLHGSDDRVVSIESQRAFYREIKPLYSDKSKIQLIEYNDLGHFVSTKMMSDTAIWFRKNL